MRRLIVNGDDFGQTAGINDGIIRCHEHGVLTSASLMVRWPHANAAAAYARATPSLSVGLHLDLGEWVYRSGEWTPLYQVAATDDADAVKAEVLRQLDAFRRVMGADPTHLDSHQHVHLSTPADGVVNEIGGVLNVPIRNRHCAIQYLGSFYGQDPKGVSLKGILTVGHLIEILRQLPDGTTELGCHPGLHGDADGMYVVERAEEVAVLCDPRVRATLRHEQIDLVSFRDHRGARPPG